MSNHQALKQSCLAMGVIALLLAGSASLSYGGSCSPATPCPCAADGICRPNPDWGFSKTRWRQWPGERTDLQSTDDGMLGEGALQPGFGRSQLPKPEEEGLRGPVKEKREKAPAADEGEGILLPELEAEPDFEAEEPGFDPLGTLHPLPNTDDSPPALPASLRQAARSILTPQLEMLIETPVLSQTLPQALPQVLPAPTAQLVHPVNFQDSHSIQLINPASAILSRAEAVPLQQAIYYEVSDQ